MTLEQIIALICEYVEADPAQITAASSLRNDIGATSFDLMNIAAAVEETFGVTVPDDRLPTVKTVGDIVGLIGETKGA